MKKSVRVALPLSVLLMLTACGTTPHRDDKFRALTACKVDVHVHKNRIYVDQEPVYTKRCAAGDPVLFFLRGGGNNATLAIKITEGPEPRPDCGSTGPKTFKCTLHPSTAPLAKFKYEVEITRDTQTYEKLDPMIIND